MSIMISETMAPSVPAAAVKTITLKPVDLTEEGWKPFGQIVSAQPDGKGFDSLDAQLDLSRGIPRFYIMRLEGRQSLTFGNITHHAKVTQCLGSMGAQPWYLGVARPSIVRGQHDDLARHSERSGKQRGHGVVLAKAGHSYVPPSPDEVRVFRINGPQFIKLDVGTWHAGPFFKANSMDFFNLELSDTNVVDHTTHKFKEDGVTFQIDD